MRPVPIGARGIFSIQVLPQHLASQFKDAILPEVFATPMMVLAMENAALNAIRVYLDPGESTCALSIKTVSNGLSQGTLCNLSMQDGMEAQP
jgi:fluoroacetyl-CoA thioesterase